MLLATFVIWGGGKLYRQIISTEAFRLDQIIVNEESPFALPEIQKILALPEHISLLALDLNEVRRKLESQAQVASVSVFRELPNRLRLNIVPEEPVFVGNLGGLVYFGSEGQRIAKVSPGNDLHLPLVTFENESAADPTTQRRIESTVRLIALIKKSQDLRVENIGDILIRKPSYRGKAEIRMTMLHKAINDSSRKSIEVSFSAEDEADQVNRLATVVKELSTKQMKLSKIRLELGKKVIVKISQ